MISYPFYRRTTPIMKYPLHIALAAIAAVGMQTASAEGAQIGIVNVTQIFNQSAFVQNANKKLQDNVTKMEAQVQAQQKKIQSLASQYEAIKGSNPQKAALQKQIVDEQTKLTKMADEFQQQIKKEQSAGMQDYTKLLQSTTAKVAKDKHLTGVLSSNAVIYADPSWIDITSDVARAMPAKS